MRSDRGSECKTPGWFPGYPERKNGSAYTDRWEREIAGCDEDGKKTGSALDRKAGGADGRNGVENWQCWNCPQIHDCAKNVKPNCEVCRMRIWNKVQHGNQRDSENSDYLHRLSENEGRKGLWFTQQCISAAKRTSDRPRPDGCGNQPGKSRETTERSERKISGDQGAVQKTEKRIFLWGWYIPDPAGKIRRRNCDRRKDPASLRRRK